MKISPTIVIIWLLCATQQLFASNTNDGPIQPLDPTIDQFLSKVPNNQWSFRRWFEYGLEENGMDNYRQRFGPLSKFTWSQIAISDHQFLVDRVRSKGQAYFSDSLGESVLSGFNSWFNFNRFKEVCNPAVTFGAKFAEGSLDPKEGRLEPSSIDPGNVAPIHRWISTFFRNDRTRYGLKLISNKPYVYYSRAFWENGDGSPFVIVNSRFRLTASSTHTKRMELDEHLLFPLDDKNQLSIGCRIFPNGFGSEISRPSFTVRMSHQLFGNVDDDIIYLSAQLNDTDQIFLFGFSLSKIISQ